MSFRHLVNVAIGLLIAFGIVQATRHHQPGASQAEEIRENLTNERTRLPSLDQLSVQVDGASRTAVISGRVDTQAEREIATEVALQTRGLLTVFNDVRADALREELLIDLRELAEDDPTVGDFNYRIHPDGHTVTLEGWVEEDHPGRIAQLRQLVEDVPGVREIHDNMRVGRPDEDINRIQELIFDILRLGNIYFDYNKATIRPESLESVGKIAGVLEEYPSVRLRVEGHTDSIASEDYNQRLSEARAESVMTSLVEFGVSPERIDAVGYGETRPIAPNDTPEGRADNRRIEFKVLHADEGEAAPGGQR